VLTESLYRDLKGQAGVWKRQLDTAEEMQKCMEIELEGVKLDLRVCEESNQRTKEHMQILNQENAELEVALKAHDSSVEHRVKEMLLQREEDMLAERKRLLAQVMDRAVKSEDEASDLKEQVADLQRQLQHHQEKAKADLQDVVMELRMEHDKEVRDERKRFIDYQLKKEDAIRAEQRALIQDNEKLTGFLEEFDKMQKQLEAMQQDRTKLSTTLGDTEDALTGARKEATQARADHDREIARFEKTLKETRRVHDTTLKLSVERAIREKEKSMLAERQHLLSLEHEHVKVEKAQRKEVLAADAVQISQLREEISLLRMKDIEMTSLLELRQQNEDELMLRVAELESQMRGQMYSGASAGEKMYSDASVVGSAASWTAQAVQNDAEYLLETIEMAVDGVTTCAEVATGKAKVDISLDSGPIDTVLPKGLRVSEASVSASVKRSSSATWKKAAGRDKGKAGYKFGDVTRAIMNLKGGKQ